MSYDYSRVSHGFHVKLPGLSARLSHAHRPMGSSLPKAEIFDELKEGLVPLIKEITSAPQLKINKKITESTFDVDKQEALCEKVMEKVRR